MSDTKALIVGALILGSIYLIKHKNLLKKIPQNSDGDLPNVNDERTTQKPYNDKKDSTGDFVTDQQGGKPVEQNQNFNRGYSANNETYSEYFDKKWQEYKKPLKYTGVAIGGIGVTAGVGYAGYKIYKRFNKQEQWEYFIEN